MINGIKIFNIYLDVIIIQTLENNYFEEEELIEKIKKGKLSVKLSLNKLIEEGIVCCEKRENDEGYESNYYFINQEYDSLRIADLFSNNLTDEAKQKYFKSEIDNAIDQFYANKDKVGKVDFIVLNLTEDEYKDVIKNYLNFLKYLKGKLLNSEGDKYTFAIMFVKR